MARIINYTETTGLTADDYLVIDNETSGTKKIKGTNAFPIENTPTEGSNKALSSGGAFTKFAEVKEDLTAISDTLYGEELIDASTTLSNNNTAVVNNGDGTYSVGTTDYGTTVFGAMVTLAKGEYTLNGVGGGFMCISTSTSPNDAIVVNKSEDPIIFQLAESTDCYLIFRASARPSTAFTLVPYIRAIGTEGETKLSVTKVESIPVEDTLTTYLQTGYYIATNVSDGASVTTTPVRNAEFACGVFPCRKGDTFTLTGTGGSSALLWTFTNTNFVKVSGSVDVATTSNLPLMACEDGFLIVNVAISAEYALTAQLIPDLSNTKTTRRITNPHQLRWLMRTFDSSGPQTGSFTDRMYTTCHVKAGSIIAAFSAGGVNVSIGYWIDGSTSDTMDYFRSYNYQAITIPYDCTLYIGALYNSPVYLPNDSLLDNVYFNLICDEYESKYSKKDSAVFGNPVDVYYEGQHTDETGFTNATTDIDAVHSAFDALVTASNGYLTCTDLGVAYDTYHMYQYDTVPVGLHVTNGLTVPKVAIICCEHGNEKMSAYAMHYLLHDLVYKSTKNPVLSYLRSNCKLSVIPVANPWGFLNTSRWNENGVNLNRNFPTYNWDEYSTDTSGEGGINYKGASAASETQTQMLIAFLRSNYDAVFAIDLHTNGEDTSAWYEICTTIIPMTSDTDSADYEVQSSYVDPAKVHINRIKPWLDENYGSDLGAIFYGCITYPEDDRPTTAQWIRESNNMMGFTFEVMAGSTTDYLGTTLTKYAPATIKAAAEEIGNFLVAMLINCKNV